ARKRPPHVAATAVRRGARAERRERDASSRGAGPGEIRLRRRRLARASDTARRAPGIQRDPRGALARAGGGAARGRDHARRGDALARIFEPYYRAPATSTVRGTGLGLAVVKALVEAHGGVIHVESARDAGTRVAFSLPAVP